MFYYKLMPRNIFIGTLLILLLATLTLQQEPTLLSYYVEYEQDQDDNFIEATLGIKASSGSLAGAIQDAREVADKVTQVGQQYCRDFEKQNKQKVDCSKVVEVSRLVAKPSFQQVRRDDVFEEFVVTHDVTIAIYYPDQIGKLIDVLLQIKLLTFTGFEWLPFQEKDPEDEAIKQGLVEGKDLCKRAGLAMGRILSLEEVLEEQEEGAEEEQEEGPSVTIYKFEVECLPKVAKSSKK